MWSKPWSYKEGLVIGAGLLVIGLLLQMTVGAIHWDLFACPVIARLCGMHHIDAEAAEEMIEKADKRRSEYYNYYSYKTWGAAATYHLCIDSSSLGIEETVRFIEEFVVKKLQLV